MRHTDYLYEVAASLALVAPLLLHLITTHKMETIPAYNRPGTLHTRIRQNVKDLSPDAWARFVGALKTLKTRIRPGGVVSIYDEFCALHMGAVELNREWRRKAGAQDANQPADPAHDNPGCEFSNLWSIRAPISSN